MEERALSFGAVAELYDRMRPGYPDGLFSDVIDLLPGRTVVEVGAGTGKASVPLVSRGIALTCIEPDPAMAALLTAKCPVPVVSASFEDWSPAGQFDGLLSAQAWHWTKPATRWTKAATVLRPGGLLALFWNTQERGAVEIHEALDEVYQRHGVAADDRPVIPIIEPDPWPGTEIQAEPAFAYLGVRSYHWFQSYTAADFAAYLNTTSFHRIMAAERRDAISTDIAAAINQHGGRFDLARRTDLYLARRR